ncbi:hypothetical protein CFC21_013094 [Triticum aestivum]|uniref:Uncharacterized protein n=3 Tax=Triticinae TaxID=1648030 RepID=A0A452ZJC0_AEGTS|nr:uncharacterized protein LOC109750797 [Aegilops tauschii subsp. strangulata]XP_044445623.1 uncharacterized protein LOC123172758 [Triticum aestivum]KAF6996794.1 hypothetical protein CFC21_013094 [Triticum aestivum]
MKQEKGQGGGGGKKLGRWLGAPVRALSRACDSYVRKMSACAGAMPTQYAGAVGRGGAGAMRMQAATFSSRSTRRGDDDVGELVRAMSQRQQGSGASPAAAAVPPRSRSVGVGRIDEDAPCDFGADAGRVGLPPPAVRRSRSAAVGSGLPPRVGGGGGFGAATIKKAAPAGVVVHGG